MNEFDILATAASGMAAQRTALDIAARNVAASEADGSFERLVPRFSMIDDGASAQVRFLGTSRQAGVHADAITEMVGVLDAQRAYEANASVFDLAKRLAERTIEAGRS
ncbi:MAG TPA: flagellar basal body rod C-terminal domain-containing protein [Candidatus Baltobacteraceae bacterium]|jgi:flagellar basal body rod protein FlgC|nr:flagellar basal body rod C-terminal domain-containing protein [Candidatus Baltobacteraceae bacterium]